MTIPAILFGIFLSTLYGAGFHFWRGGDMKRLLVYLVLGWAGFWGGQYLGGLAGITFWQTGGLYLGAATLSAAILLYGGYLAMRYLWPEK
jgi:hypothetical protein